jgi:hypothetical protein
MNRHARNRGARALTAIFFVLLPCFITRAGEPEYDIEQLVPLPGLFPLTVVHDLDGAGRAVGRTWKEEAVGVQNHHAVLWNAPSEPTDIGDNGRWSEARGISSTGFIAGRHDLAAGMRGALWTPQGRQMLPPLSGQPASEAYGVDDAGVAIGVSLISSTDVTAVRWVNGVPSALPGANGSSWAVAVNGSGRAVGQRDVWPERHAMLWEGATFTVLQDLGGDFAWATNVSEGGTISGGSFDSFSQIVAVLWDSQTLYPTPLANPDFGAFARVKDVNDQGVAVGEVCLSIECEAGDSRALVWRDGAVYDLNDLIPPGSGWTLFSAEAVNESGEIVCIGAQNGFVSPRGFKLTPRETTSITDAERATASLRLFPNPTRGDGEISWTSPIAGDVTLSLFDVRGRLVATRRLGALPAGTSSFSLALLAPPGLANGLYVLELRRSDSGVETVRVTVVR